MTVIKVENRAAIARDCCACQELLSLRVEQLSRELPLYK